MNRRLFTWRGAVFVGIALSFAGLLQADEETPERLPASQRVKPSEIRRVFVPADRPSEWPAGDWLAIDRRDYLQLLEGLAPAEPHPDRIGVQSARYRAVFNGRQLVNGRLQADVQQFGGERLLNLGSTNLHFQSFSWGEDAEAIWGNTKTGSLQVVLPSNDSAEQNGPAASGLLTGKWSAGGRASPGRVEMDLKLPAAAVNELEFLLPRGWELTASAGRVSGPHPPEEESLPLIHAAKQNEMWSVWRIDWGSRSDGVIVFRRVLSGPRTRSLILAKSESNYLLQEREFQVEARFELDVAFESVSRLTFEVPRSIRVFSVSYGGETGVSWRARRQRNRQVIELSLPEPLLGKSRPIRIQGMGVVPFNRAWQLPTMTCADAYLLEADVNLTVRAPLELKSFDARGYRQTAISVEPDKQESLTFSQIAPHAEAVLTAFVGTPSFSATAQVVSDLTIGSEEWVMQSEIHWVLRAGSRFVVHCEIRPGWEILDVRRSKSGMGRVISDWRVTPRRPQANSRLTIEFLESLTPMQDKRVILVARRLPIASGRSIPLSPVKPLSCQSVEQFLAVHSTNTLRLESTATSQAVSWDDEQLPDFVASSEIGAGWSATETGGGLQSFYAPSLTDEAPLRINRRDANYDGTVNVTYRQDAGHFEQTIEFFIEPLGQPVGSVVFRAGEFGGDWIWELLGPETATLSPPNRQRVETNGDGLFELPLPDLQQAPFRVTARHSGPIQGNHEILLPSLPEAKRFQGSLHVRGPSPPKFEISGNTITEETPEDSGSREFARRWRYDSAARATVRQIAGDLPTPLGQLRLLSRIDGQIGKAVHTARFQLFPLSHDVPLRFELPADVNLIEAKWNGEPVSAALAEPVVISLTIPKDAENVVEIRYQSDWDAERMVSACPIPLPKSNLSILNSTWQVAVSPNHHVAGFPESSLVRAGDRGPNWTTRFFGPIGRKPSESVFRAWLRTEWSDLFHSEVKPNASSVEKSAEVPADWQVYEADLPLVGPSLELRLWNRPLGRQWAWVAILANLMIGLFLRRLDWGYRRHLGVFVVVVYFLGAGFLPWPWAMIAGGGLAGTALAFLLPRRLVMRQRATADPPSSVGSTASLTGQPVIHVALIIGCGLGIWTVTSPTSAQTRESSNAFTAARRGPLLPESFNVMIPVDRPKSPQNTPKLIYVDREFLDRLKRSQPPTPAEFPYLIRKADYQVSVDPAGTVGVELDLDVIHLDATRPVTVGLPIQNAFPGGPGHCRVDGQAQPLFYDKEAREYRVTISPHSSSASKKPAIAEKPGSVPPDFLRPASHRIQLKLHGSAEISPSHARYVVGVPRISRSNIEAVFAEEFSLAMIRGRAAEFRSAGTDRRIAASLGFADQWELAWFQDAQAARESFREQLDVMALATVYPHRVEWRIRVKGPATSGLSWEEWNLPPETIVRGVKSDQIQAYRVERRSAGPHLIMEFQKAKAAEFLLEITCTTPNQFSASGKSRLLRLPAWELFDRGESAKQNYAIAVASAPEIEIEPQAVAGAVATLDPEEFLNAFRRSTLMAESFPKPLWAWKPTEPFRPVLSLKPRLPTVRNRIEQTGRLRARELLWKFSADTETRDATIFRHALKVPADLVIDSVSVTEDETERLARWSRSGDHVELVLNDGTTASQKIELTGHLPIVLAPENRIPLPMIAFDGAEAEESRLRLLLGDDVTHHVQINPEEELMPFEDSGFEAMDSNMRPLGSFELAGRDVAPILVVKESIAPLRYRSAVRIAQDAAGPIQYTTLLNFREQPLWDAQVTIDLPASLAGDFRLTIPQRPGHVLPYETRKQGNGSLQLIIKTRDLGKARWLRVRSELPGRFLKKQPVPRVTIANGEIEESIVLTPAPLSAAPLDPETQTPAEELDALPEWLKSQPSIADALGMNIARLDSAWKLEARRQDAETSRKGTIVESSVWLMPAGPVVGETILRFENEVKEEVIWHRPLGTTIKAASLDGEAVPIRLAPESFRIPLAVPDAKSSTAHTLILHWIQDTEEPLTGFSQLGISIPRPMNVTVTDSPIHIVPPRNVRLIPADSKSIDYQEPSAEGVQGLLRPQADAWLLRFWTMDARAENGLLIFVLALVLGGILYWGLRLNTGRWLYEHPAVCLGLVGLFWWTCLSASLLGFCVLAVAPLYALFRRQYDRTLKA